SPTWSDTITQESQIGQFMAHGSMFMFDLGKDRVIEMLRNAAEEKGNSPEELAAFKQMLETMEPEAPPIVDASKFDYVQGDLPPFPVSLILMRLHDDKGEFFGGVELYSSSLPASVLALVARGNEGMFTRMARLVEPGRRQAAILFADLQDSSVMSRRLPTGAFFKLIRALTTAYDEVVIGHDGIVGKHAGDGVSAFFLADDLGSPSAAAKAAIAAARDIAEAAGTAAKEAADETGLINPADCLVNVGVHWGGTLYMGQLVTGGRLEVTALGDAVNECARIQDTARDGEALASKSLIEHLTDADAAALGLDPDGVVYRTLAELPAAGDKAIRDAGGIPVTVL
ncbi:MAG: adenylate/guanylate cyclase domain-containing protein, partial [Actinomycetota bacterium]